MTQKTFDAQTATFISKLVTSFPGDMSGEEMQKCIDDPKGLRDSIRSWLRPEALKPEGTKQDRITFTVTGLGLTGEEWKKRLKSGGHKLSDWASDILSKPDYDAKHRLEKGKEYKLTLVFGKEIKKDKDRTTTGLKSLARKESGDDSVSGLKGEFALLIREKFSNAALEEMGIWYIAVLHEPIVDSGGSPDVLRADRDDDGSWVGAGYDDPDDPWSGSGAFAFLAR